MQLKNLLSSCLFMQLSYSSAFAAESKIDSVPDIKNIISALPARCVGFFGVQDRYSDLAVFEENPMIFYVASANGGVLKTVDGGRYFDFVFDKAGSSSIGAITVSQKDHHVIWVGTGDQWQRNSVGIGNGIYKSENSGKTWEYMGLKECVSFSKIILHPTNDKIVIAAGLGNAWAGDQNRGVYRSEDGGKTWKKVLFVNETAGVGDLIIDPKNPNNLIAGLWDHVHRPYGRRGGGAGSGIYKSKDGGKTWRKITKGLPQVNVGRIGLDYFRSNPKLVVAAIEEPIPGSSMYRSYDGGETWRSVPARHKDDSTWISEGGKIKHIYDPTKAWYRPYYNQVVRFDPVDDNIIYHGFIMHNSKDGGKTFVGGTGDDHGLWINPRDPSHSINVADGGVNQLFMTTYPNITRDGIVKIRAVMPPMCQIYGIGYDMRKLYSVMGNSQDGMGLSIGTQSTKGYISYHDPIRLEGSGENGKSISDPEDWKTIYTSRGEGLYRVDLETGESKDVKVSKKSWPGYARADEYEQYKKLDTAFRAGWNFAFQISPWNSHTLYFGANYLFKSIDRGDSWSIISPDLTHNKKEWQVPDQPVYPNGNDNSGARMYQTIRTVCESPMLQGVIWVGTDDGYVQLTKDGGKTWKNVTANIKGLPEFTWVSHVYASRFAPGRTYATFDGHRNGDLNTYVYMTEDFGETWTKITGTLPPNESAYVIKEGLRNPDLLYVGTEFGLYISLDRGKHWEKYQDWKSSSHDYTIPSNGYFPTVAVHDLEIHARELDLIVGTHGRSIWTIPTSPLEELTQDRLKEEVYFPKPNTIYLFPTYKVRDPFLDEAKNTLKSLNTQPGTYFSFYLKEDCGNCEATISISDASGSHAILGEGSKQPPIKIRAKTGLNSFLWMNNTLRVQGIFGYGSFIKKPGDYKVTLSIDGKKYYQTLHVEDATDEMLPGGQKN